MLGRNVGEGKHKGKFCWRSCHLQRATGPLPRRFDEQALSLPLPAVVSMLEIGSCRGSIVCPRTIAGGRRLDVDTAEGVVSAEAVASWVAAGVSSIREVSLAAPGQSYQA